MAEELINKNSLHQRLAFGADQAAEAGLKDVTRGLLLAIGYVDKEPVYIPETVREKQDAYWIHEKNHFLSWLRCNNCDHKIYDDIWGGMYPTNNCPECGCNMLGYIEKNGCIKNFEKKGKSA